MLHYYENAGNDIIQHFEVEHDVIDLRLLPVAIEFEELSILETDDRSGVVVKHDALAGSIEIRGITKSDLTKSNFEMPDGTTTSITIEGTTINRPVDPFMGSDNSALMLDGKEDNTIKGMGGYDSILGGEGDDQIFGGAESDDLYGEEGDDDLFGEGGYDRLFAARGRPLDGRAPRTICSSAAGRRLLTGGAGADTLCSRRTHGDDTITDSPCGEGPHRPVELEGIAGFEM